MNGGLRAGPSILQNGERSISPHTSSFHSAFEPRIPGSEEATALVESRTRLSRALLFYLVGVTLIITLAPFRFESVQTFSVILTTIEPFDFIANVLLFAPIGFLFPLTFPRFRRPALTALLAGALLSTGIETVQLFEPARYSSLLDILANGLGAGTGAAVQQLLSRRLQVNGRLLGRLSLELPLMGGLYLLVPVLWVASVSVDDHSLRIIGIVLLGMAGARLFAALQRFHFGPAGASTAAGMGLLVAGWMLVGMFPLVRTHPVPMLLVAILCGASAAVAARSTESPGEERRFELFALRRAAPFIALYFAASSLVPLAYGFDEWRIWLGFSGLERSLSTVEQLRLLESIVALTLTGYLLAEARGRLELPWIKDLPFQLLCSGSLAVLLEIGRGFQSGWGGSLAQALLLTAAGLMGSSFYHAQRTHVQLLLASERERREGARSAVRSAAFVEAQPGR